MKKPIASTLAMLALSGNAAALEIGDLKVDSHLGEAFMASVRILASPDETVDSSCVSLDQASGDSGIFQLKNAKIAVQSANGTKVVKISTSQNISEPILTLKLRLRCSNQGEIAKSFTIFLDPASSAPSLPVVPQETTQQPIRGKALPGPSVPKKAASSEIVIKPNDTLSGIAHDFHPYDTKAQKRFVASVMQMNPGLLPDRLQVGAKLRIPETKTQPEKAHAAVEPNLPEKVEPKKGTKPAFRLDIVSGESKTDTGSMAAQELKRTETQLISRADDQTVQMLQLKDQIKTLESKLAELQKRVAVTNKMLAAVQAAKVQQREESGTISRWIWIAVLLALMGIGGIVYWFLKRRKAREEEQEALLDQYLNPAVSKPALIDHLDYFESDTPDHHKW